MPIYGLRSEDTLLGPDGKPLTGVALELYASQADAEARTNLLEAPAVTLGRWSSSDRPEGEVWARTPGGEVYQIVYPTSTDYVDAAVAAVRTDMAAKADAAAVNAALAGKADATTTQAALDAKADRTDFLGRLAAKADRSTVDLQLASKASTTDLQNAVAGLATLAQLNTKADAAAVEQALAYRATTDDLAAAESRAATKGTADAKAYTDGKAKANADALAAHTGSADPHPSYFTTGRGDARYARNAWQTPGSSTMEILPQQAMPLGASSSRTGVIVLEIPTNPNVASMVNVELDILTYGGGGPMRTTLRANVYARQGATLQGASASVRSDGRTNATPLALRPPRVRWVRSQDYTRLFLVVGESTTSWPYLQTVTSRVLSGYGPEGVGTPKPVTVSATVPTGSSTLEAFVLDASGVHRGVGSPEGVVTADVGARYIDNNATNGAIEWVKTTDAATWTGWRVSQGDTGWRDVSATLDKTGTILDQGKPNTLRVRRIGSMVEFQVSVFPVVSTGGTALAALPTGFVANGGAPYPGVAETGPYRPFVAVPTSGGSLQGWGLAGFAAGSTVKHSVHGSGLVDSGWPSVLPGTPA